MFESEQNERWSLRKALLKKKREMMLKEEMAHGNLVTIGKNHEVRITTSVVSEETKNHKTYKLFPLQNKYIIY